MEPLATAENQITLIYNGENSLGKQALAYAKAAKNSLNPIDISKNNLTSKQWSGIAERLQLPLKELVATDHPDFKALYDEEPLLTPENWLKIIAKNPKLIKSCIVIKGDSYELFDTPSKIQSCFDHQNSNVSRSHTS